MTMRDSFDKKHNWRLNFHLQVATGDMTDPNGLCELDGTYHFFHQHRRFWPNPGHGWAHWVSDDLVTWRWMGAPIMPDCELDKNGSYSGSAVVRDGEMWCYYTGNQLLPGDHDFDYSGRLANETLVRSDGERFGEKRLVLGNEGYPAYCSCHVRDPKVWEQDGTWHMLLGARVKGDRGAVLLFGSPDGLDWKLEGSATNMGDAAFGYMWECPNVARIGGREFLLVCPQGVPKRPFSFENIHDSGYFPMEGTVVDLLSQDHGLMNADGPYRCIDEKDFVELDYGFDFYAPQVFEDETGRTILVGWASLPDIETQYDNPTREWVHTLTVPRELVLNDAGRICQRPVAEVDSLRGEKVELTPEGARGATGTVGSSPYDQFDLTGAVGETFPGTCDLVLEGISGEGRVLLNADLELLVTEGLVELSFTGMAGAYRTVRRLPATALSAGRVTKLRVLVDTSIVEVFVNDGEVTMTTRWYPQDTSRLRVTSTVPCESATAWKMGSYTFENVS